MPPKANQIAESAMPTTEKQPDPACHIVSPNTMQAQLLKSYLDSRFTIEITCHQPLSIQALIDKLSHGRCIYLLDCLSLDSTAIGTFLDATDSTPPPEQIMVALYNIDDGDYLAPLVKRHRIRGIFFRDDAPSIFVKGMQTLLDGHLWLKRSLLSGCILLGDQPTGTKQSAAALASLTRREIEILKHVVVGQSNQEIADDMSISLHTVKTHLYNVFKKIKVPNRLQGALWAATHLGAQSNN